MKGVPKAKERMIVLGSFNFHPNEWSILETEVIMFVLGIKLIEDMKLVCVVFDYLISLILYY